MRSDIRCVHRIWAAKDYVDDTRIGIWGWVSIFRFFVRPKYLTKILLQSYGGFMSCKVAEANAGVHSLAMAIAVSVALLICLTQY